MDPLTLLAVVALAWFLLHVLVSGSKLRGWVVAAIGERPYRGLFSLLSLIFLSALIWAYRRAPCAPLWSVSRELLYLPSVVMPVSLTLLAGAFLVRNPTAVAAESALSATEPARGVLRITRHPFLWAVTSWAAVHLLVNGNLASLLFFGSMALTALAGTRDIDKKRLQTHPELFANYRAATSNLPFLAIVTGRNRLVLREIGLPLACGAALTVLLLTFHQQWFHVRPFP